MNGSRTSDLLTDQQYALVRAFYPELDIIAVSILVYLLNEVGRATATRELPLYLAHENELVRECAQAKLDDLLFQRQDPA